MAAVNRFISAAVPDLSKEQKAALREAGAAAAGAGTRGRGEGQGEAADAAAAFLQGTMAELQGAPEQGGGGKRRKTGGSKR